MKLHLNILALFFSMNTFGQSFKYLALGDSYTIGEAVEYNKNFPNQLHQKIISDPIFTNQFKTFPSPTIIATTGWTTNELQNAINEKHPAGGQQLVTLLIGVNNQYRGQARGYTLLSYQQEFEELLKKAISLAEKKEYVVVVSIPDYGVTPFAKEFQPDKIYNELVQYNQAAEKICKKYQVPFVNITEKSREAATNPALIASDGLHPSALMYTNWVNEIFPVVKKIYQK